MTPDLDRLFALGEARSCLAALADTAEDDVVASHFEHLLIALDMVEPQGPATWPVAADHEALLVRLTTAMDRLGDLGADPLPLAQIVTLAHVLIRRI